MALSGAAALIFEIVWLRMLSRAFGVTVHAVSFLIALYFAGLVLGSAAAAAWADKKADWLAAYAGLELLGGLSALGTTLWMRFLPGLVAAFPFSEAGPDFPRDTFLRFCLAGPALLIPTFFFGATLPVLCRQAAAAGLRQTTGLLYAANTAGALLGTGAAGFLLIAWMGETVSAAAAGALNLCAALGAYTASGHKIPWRTFLPRGGMPLPPRLRAWGTPSAACLLFALSGFCAMGYEVLWSRRLILLLGTSSYAFTFLLLCYLGGTAAGSALSARTDGSRDSAWGRFGLLELAIAAAALIGARIYFELGVSHDSPDFLYLQIRSTADLPRLALHAAAVVFPPALLMGYLFPLAARLEADSGETGAAVGRIYAYNTAGGILGSLTVGFIGIETLGTHGSLLALSALSALIGAAALMKARGGKGASRPAVLAMTLLVCVSAWAARRDRTLEILGRRIRHGARGNPVSLLFHEERAAGTATGVRVGNTGQLYINGIVIAGTGFNGALMTILPNVFQERVERTLLVGVGAGVSLVTASLLGGEVHAAELLRPVAENLAAFQPGRENLYRRPGTRIVFEDGRNFLLRSKNAYDSVIVDGSPPLYSAGTTNLYTTDFLKLVRSRLSPAGVFTLWLPLPSYEEDYWNILKGMFAVFPHVRVWNHPDVTGGVIFFGSKSPLEWEPGLLDKRLGERVRGSILTGLTEEKVRAGFRVSEADLRAHSARARLVTDDLPITEYPLGKILAGKPLMRSDEFLLKAAGAAGRAERAEPAALATTR